MNTQIIPVSNIPFNDQVVEAVDGRLLHERLEVGTEFRFWVQRRIDDAGLEEGIDFVIIRANLHIPENINNLGFSVTPKAEKEYWFTLDAAKHMAMLERTPQGKLVRNYFIDLERDFKGKLAELQKWDIRTEPASFGLMLAVSNLISKFANFRGNLDPYLRDFHDRLEKGTECRHKGMKAAEQQQLSWEKKKMLPEWLR